MASTRATRGQPGGLLNSCEVLLVGKQAITGQAFVPPCRVDFADRTSLSSASPHQCLTRATSRFALVGRRLHQPPAMTNPSLHATEEHQVDNDPDEEDHLHRRDQALRARQLACELEPDTERGSV